MNGKLTLDIDMYYNAYRNLMAQLDANVPKTQNTDSAAYYLQNNSKQNLYRLWTNSKAVSYNYGATLGIHYQLLNKFNAGGNFTYAKLTRKDQSDGLEDGFNTPEWTYNLFFGTAKLYKTLGFNVNYRKQAAFLWQSALATGNVDSYSTLDAQVSAAAFNSKVTIKVGASNLLNSYYYSFIGGPSIGGFYYTNVVYAF